MIKIKPHHFMDIIKLYGRGTEVFIPDQRYKHNFYLVANEIINNRRATVQLTVHKDDICEPCIYSGSGGICSDGINHIEHITSKDEWNKILDKRIMELVQLFEGSEITASEFCERLYQIREAIPEIWREEDAPARKSRQDDFCAGARKYLGCIL